ncbi:hypothetical protein [Archangium lansingense]|uniref:Uncharacterized protein n=1 Tax=Archangium lansingense TaxID=2995310 RepID=A0ABT4AKG6_9BACT|nr:hypothetical protein [Archangium lansinium]MCY1082178.1 hypothetical protein [Archangium lansinium]
MGWDKGTAVTPEYGSNTKFTGRVLRVDFDLKPDFHPDYEPDKQAEAKFAHQMLRQ